MRKLGIFALILAVFIAPTAWSQAGPGPGPGGHRGMHSGRMQQNGVLRMSQQLNLTQDQQTQIRDLLQKQRQQAQSIRQDTSLSTEQRQQQIQQLRQSTHQQVLGVLTPEQQTKLKELEKQRRDGGMAALNLTPEQRAKLQPIREQMRKEVLAVRQDSSLTPQQKQEKIRDIRQNAMGQMKEVLTPEQQQQLEQMRQSRGRPGPPAAPPAPQGF